MADTNSNFHWIVLINDEEQYGLFPQELAIPPGWREAGFSGSEEACVAYVDQQWTDMRPLSLRKAMEADAAA
jgi:MbtH protein